MSNSKYIRIILFDAVLAIILVVAYSPGLMGLSPFDPDIFRAGMAIIIVCLVVVAFVYFNITVLFAGNNDNGISSTTSGNRVLEVLDDHVHDQIIGSNAAHGLDELTRAIEKHEKLDDMISKRFGHSTLTGNSFESTVSRAIDTVKRNCALLASLMQSFDVPDYVSHKNLIESGEYKNDGIDDAIQLERIQMYNNMLKKMDSIVSANEKLLLEIDKAIIAMSGMSFDDLEDDNAGIVSELSEMTRRLALYDDD